PEGLRTALAMLDKTSFPEMGPEELRARAVVLVAQTGRKYQEEAIRTLEYLNRRQPLSPEDRFLLVQLYERVGEQPKAREELERVLAADGKNPRYLAYKVRGLLRQRLTNEAQTWVGALEEVDRDGLTT